MNRSNAEVASDSSADSDSSDDISLTKLKEKLTAENKREVNTSIGTKNKKADCLDTNESSDNEPLIKVAKEALQTDKKVESGPGKTSVDKEDDDSSDDEPLSVLATKLKPKPPKEVNVKNSRVTAKVVESKRTASRKRVKLAELSSDSSDNETLATVKQKLIKRDRVQKASPKQKKTKFKESSPRDSSSEDDDLPLAHLIAKKKKDKANVDSQVGASGKSRGHPDPSSEDEPLVNLVKKRQAQSKVKTPEKKETQPKRLEEKHLTGSSSDEDDMALVNLVHKMKSGKKNTTAKSKVQDGASTKSRGNSEGSSEDEPLINLAKNRKGKTPQRKTRGPKKQDEKHAADFSSDSSSEDDDLPLVELKAKRMLGTENAKRKIGASRKRQEIPEGSSEDEPLINLVKKRKVQPTVKSLQRKTRSPEKRVAGKDSKALSLDSSSEDDDLPLVELKAKRMLGKENSKRKVESQVSASRKRQGISDPSSEDEPLINLVKQRRGQSKVMAPQKNKTPPILREQQVHGSTSDWSDDEPAKKDASHPQLTKFVKIILGRCDDEETARSHNETSNGHVDNVC